MDVWTPDRDEPLSIAAWFVPEKRQEKRLARLKIRWGNTWRVLDVTFYHDAMQGNRKIHYVSAYDGSTYYRLEFDPQALLWTLKGVDDGTD